MVAVVQLHFRASVAEQLGQILDQLLQKHPASWSLECERARFELMMSAGDANALVNAAESKEQIGLWFQSKKEEGQGSKKEEPRPEKDQQSWIDDQDLLRRKIITERQGCGYDTIGFVG